MKTSLTLKILNEKLFQLIKGMLLKRTISLLKHTHIITTSGAS